MPSYTESSSILGSIRASLTSLGRALYRIARMMELMATLLPEPVAPATSRCGILSMLPITDAPKMSLPRGILSFDLFDWYSGVSRIWRK